MQVLDRQNVSCYNLITVITWRPKYLFCVTHGNEACLNWFSSQTMSALMRVLLKETHKSKQDAGPKYCSILLLLMGSNKIIGNTYGVERSFLISKVAIPVLCEGKTQSEQKNDTSEDLER